MNRLFLGFFCISFLHGAENRIGHFSHVAGQYPKSQRDEKALNLLTRRFKRLRKDSLILISGEEGNAAENIKEPAKKRRKKSKDTVKISLEGKDFLFYETLDEPVPYFLKSLMKMVAKDDISNFNFLCSGLYEIGFNAWAYRNSQDSPLLSNYLDCLNKEHIKLEYSAYARGQRIFSFEDLKMFQYFKERLETKDTRDFIADWDGIIEIGINPLTITNVMDQSLLVAALKCKDFLAFKYMMTQDLCKSDKVSKDICLEVLKQDIGMSEAEKEDYRMLLA